MTDKELLEFAAKAAAAIGVPIIHSEAGPQILERKTPDGVEFYRLWVPLTDDGDALRLAVACNIWPRLQNRDMPPPYIEYVHVVVMREETGATALSEVTIHERSNEARAAATRRAIVRAAAKIGKQKG